MYIQRHCTSFKAKAASGPPGNKGWLKKMLRLTKLFFTPRPSLEYKSSQWCTNSHQKEKYSTAVKWTYHVLQHNSKIILLLLLVSKTDVGQAHSNIMMTSLMYRGTPCYILLIFSLSLHDTVHIIPCLEFSLHFLLIYRWNNSVLYQI